MRAWPIASLVVLAGSSARADPYMFDAVGVDLWHFAGVAHAAPRTTSAGPAIDDGRRIAAIDQRVGAGLADGPYVALDVELGAFAAEPAGFEAMLVVAAAGLQHRLGPATLAAELAAGVAVSDDGGGVRADLVLDPRARVAVEITGNVAIGGVVGASLVGDGWMAGIALVFRHDR
jgi:hypothetical protein